jgi:hypothetical protein
MPKPCDEDERRMDRPIHGWGTGPGRSQGNGPCRHRIESGAPWHRPGLLHESPGQQTDDEISRGNRADDGRNHLNPAYSQPESVIIGPSDADFEHLWLFTL